MHTHVIYACTRICLTRASNLYQGSSSRRGSKNLSQNSVFFCCSSFAFLPVSSNSSAEISFALSLILPHHDGSWPFWSTKPIQTVDIEKHHRHYAAKHVCSNIFQSTVRWVCLRRKWFGIERETPSETLGRKSSSARNSVLRQRQVSLIFVSVGRRSLDQM